MKIRVNLPKIELFLLNSRSNDYKVSFEYTKFVEIQKKKIFFYHKKYHELQANYLWLEMAKQHNNSINLIMNI